MNARYSVVLKDLMDNEQAAEQISTALSTYPLYEQKNNRIDTIIPGREELNKKLLNHYKYREIAFETVGRFLDELQITMEEIMPYYNEMFKTIEIMSELDNPFDNVDITETYFEETSGTATNEGTSEVNSQSSNETQSSDSSQTNAAVENNSKNVHAATPQGVLDISSDDIDSIPYADDATWNKSNNSDTANSSGSSNAKSDTSSSQDSESMSQTTTSGTTEHTFTKKGNQGVNTYAHDMIEFRTSIIDVTNQIINDIRIKELFMMVF